MNRHDDSATRPLRPYRPRRTSRPAYTLVEILTATVLMIIIMMAVTVIFASITDSIAQSRATLEMSQRLRATAAILKQDLENVTAVMSPPLHPRDNSGYFQYVEGPIGPVIEPSEVAWNSDLNMRDTTVGDIDDMILLTATTKGEPYVGLINGQPDISNSAEIIWFIRGRTLYRRVLLVKPEIDVSSVLPFGFYSNFDLSVRKTWNDVGDRPILQANSLADLTRPESRFAHHPDLRAWTAPIPTPPPGSVYSAMMAKGDSVRYRQEGKVFPFFLRPWLGAPVPGSTPPKWVPGLGLPILAESSTIPTPTYAAGSWVAGDALPSEAPPGGAWGIPNYGYNWNNPNLTQMPVLSNPVEPVDAFDPWANEHPWTNVDPLTGAIAAYRANATRIGDDVILTNVLSFDVKAWDPNAPILSQATTNPLNPTVVLMPGDPGYIAQVRLLQESTQGAPPLFAQNQFMPPTGAYVDLNYMVKVPRYLWDHDMDNTTPPVPRYYPDVAPTNFNGEILGLPHFHRQGDPGSRAYGTQWQFSMGEKPYPPSFNATVKQPYEYFPSVYDTWSLHLEYNRQWVNYVSDNPGDSNRVTLGPPPDPAGYVGDEDRDGILDRGSNGFDDNGVNGVDDVGERETQPPYAVPLQGIQVSIRVFEPGSRQVREVTLIQKFRTK